MAQPTPKVTTELLPTDSKSVKWEFNNWMEHHSAYGSSRHGYVLEIGKPPGNHVVLRFLLRPFEKDANLTSFAFKGYSLCAQLLECSNSISTIRVDASASQLSRQFGYSASARGTVSPTKLKGNSVVVIDEFIDLESLACESGRKYGIPRQCDFLRDRREWESGEDLTVSICVSLFSTTENVSGGESEDIAAFIRENF